MANRPLSSPIADLQPHYDVIVVGSGYGGGVAASRFARAGKRVAVLERGKEYLPGDFPATLMQAIDATQLDIAGLPVSNPTGLYDFRVNPDINVVLGCGLGGTSLINANVSLRPDSRVFADPAWPQALRDDQAHLDAGYTLAETMLRPTPYPVNPAPAKLAALELSGGALNVACQRPPINVTFTTGINHVGVEQAACIGCGDCVSGCNVGAKNTTAMNYLPDAHNFGASFFTGCQVRHVEQDGARWRVHFRQLDSGQAAFDAPTQFVSADIVVMAAGSLGSTEILHRSSAQGLSLAKAMLGQRFTSNGDVLGFAYNGNQPIDGIGFGDRSPVDRAVVGPCITGLLDLRGTPALDEGLVIEEGSVPGAIATFLPALFSAAAATVGKAVGGTSVAEMLTREARSLFLGPYHGATRRLQTYLVMGHDDARGALEFRDDRLRVQWPGVGTQPVFEHANATLERATRPLGGKYVPNPTWNPLLKHNVITVHPLGGAVMGEDATQGVVNHKGQVFSTDTGTAVYPGLYVCDGAVMPRSIGVNPLFTITAIAERTIQLACEDRGWAIDHTLPSRPRPASRDAVSRKPGLTFTETMRGHFAPGIVDSFEAGEAAGKAAGSTFEFTLTIASDDVAALLDRPEHAARMTGIVRAPRLDANPLTAIDGRFSLLSKQPDRVGERQMLYGMRMVSESGRELYMDGFKRVRDDFGPDIWADTTTLFITVFDGPNATAPVIGKGVLHIRPDDLMRQMTTMRVPNAANLAERIEWLAKFGKFFAGSVLDTYGGVFAKPAVFDPAQGPRARRTLNLPAPEIYPIETADGANIRLTRYRGGDKGPVMLAHGLGVSSLIFTIDTIDVNLAEFLVGNGYDVWLLDFRASIDLPAAALQFSGDEIARFDYPSAVAKILSVTRAKSVQALVHCFGATTFFLSMLAGLRGVRAAVVSQIGAHIAAPVISQLKAGFHLPDVLQKLGVPTLNAAVNTGRTALEALFDEALKLQYVPPGEACTSATCHRITFMYAPLYRHDQLNTATHDALHEMFGIANITAFEHLARMVRHGTIVDRNGNDVYLPHPERLAIPIRFIHGADNQCFLPESTERTVAWLKQHNPQSLVDRMLIPGYGHIDCIFGKMASRDVFPLMLEHLERTL
ncbi:MAG: GMC family oxidoreductase N-terminal domain-containing protein [Burkholderiales bacterium]